MTHLSVTRGRESFFASAPIYKRVETCRVSCTLPPFRQPQRGCMRKRGFSSKGTARQPSNRSPTFWSPARCFVRAASISESEANPRCGPHDAGPQARRRRDWLDRVGRVGKDRHPWRYRALARFVLWAPSHFASLLYAYLANGLLNRVWPGASEVCLSETHRKRTQHGKSRSGWE
jgi:hypothetical protein